MAKPFVDRAILAVFDGVGGAPGGQAAAQAAAACLQGLPTWPRPEALLQDLHVAAQRARGATTAVVALAGPDVQLLAIGDSMAFDGQGRRLVPRDRQGETLTGWLGNGGAGHARSVPWHRGPFVLVTDGVDDVVAGPIRPRVPLVDCVTELLLEVQDRGAPDNATVVAFARTSR